MWTRWAVVAVVVAVGGCAQPKPLDCKPPREKAFGCLERYEGQSYRQMLLGCFPFSEPERIAGAWVHGFETNEFYERASASRELIHKAVGHTQLQLEDSEKLGSTYRVFQMEIVGRRSRCNMGFPRHIIVVDRVLSQAELPQP